MTTLSRSPAWNSANTFVFDIKDPLTKSLTGALPSVASKAVREYFPSALEPVVRALQEAYAARDALVKTHRRTARKLWSAHLKLELASLDANIDPILDTLSEHIANILPPHWGMKQWGLKRHAAENLVSFGPQARGAKKNEARESFSCHRIWTFLGHIHALAFLSTVPHETDAQWDLMRPFATPNSDDTFPFLLQHAALATNRDRDLCLTTPIVQRDARSPIDALLLHEAKNLVVPNTNTKMEPVKQFLEGMHDTVSVLKEPLSWFGGVALWASVFYTDAALRLTDTHIDPQTTHPEWRMLLFEGLHPTTKKSDIVKRANEANAYFLSVAKLSKHADWEHDERQYLLSSPTNSMDFLTTGFVYKTQLSNRNVAQATRHLLSKNHHWNADSLLLRAALLSICYAVPLTWLLTVTIAVQVPDVTQKLKHLMA